MNTHRTETARFPRPSVIRTHSRHSRVGGNPEWFPSFPTSSEHMRNTAGWGIDERSALVI